MSLTRPYKSNGVFAIQSLCLVNLILLSGFIIFLYTDEATFQPIVQAVAVGLSTGIAFLLFCGIVFHAVLVILCSRCRETSASYHRDLVPDSDKAEPLLDVSSCNEPTY